MTIRDTHFKISNPPLFLLLTLALNTTPLFSFIEHIKQEMKEKWREQISMKWLANNLIVFRTEINILNSILILIDSGASNHCFTDRSLLILYTVYKPLKIGLPANRNSTFVIVGRKSVKFLTELDRTTQIVTFNDILHTFNLCSSLISVSKLDQKDTYINFIKDNVIVVALNSHLIL